MSSILADIFTSKEARAILRNKFVLMIGDSVVRSCYKDLIKLLQTDSHLQDIQLKNKGERTFENDTLLEGGSLGIMSNDVTYTEVREFKTSVHLVRFYFITRCYSDYLMSICEDIKEEAEKPDVVIMNSGCWDLTRYGPNSINDYKRNLPLGIFSLTKVLPSYTVFIWNTTLPLSKDVRGGFMIPEVYEKKSKLREDVLEANFYATNIMREFKLDVLDLHYYFLNHIQRRAKDGIHWDATAHRRITNLLLNHLCDVWDLETPGRILFRKNPNMMSLPENFKFYEDDQNYEQFYPEDSDTTDLPYDLTNQIENIVNMIDNGHSNSNDINNNNSNSNNNINNNNNTNNNSSSNKNKNKKQKLNHNFKNGYSHNRSANGSNTVFNFNQFQNQIPIVNPIPISNQIPITGSLINPLFQAQLQSQLTQILTPIIHQTIVQPSNLFQNQYSTNNCLKRKYSNND